MDDGEDPFSLFRLDGRVAIVTGASSGLGSRFAQVLSRAGAYVVIAARRLDRLEELIVGIPGAIAVETDVSKDDDLSRLVDRTIAQFGKIDILVNNAGIVNAAPAEDESPEDFRRVIAVNLTSPFILSQLVVRHMIDGEGGSIINVASVLGIVGAGQIPQASYAASKGGVVNLTRELAAQWARRSVRVNALAPGWFPSEITAEMLDSSSGQRWIARHTPMGRPGIPHELDGALLFLASDASSFVTGQILAVDGGWTAV